MLHDGFKTNLLFPLQFHLQELWLMVIVKTVVITLASIRCSSILIIMSEHCLNKATLSWGNTKTDYPQRFLAPKSCGRRFAKSWQAVVAACLLIADCPQYDFLVRKTLWIIHITPAGGMMSLSHDVTKDAYSPGETIKTETKHAIPYKKYKER